MLGLFPYKIFQAALNPDSEVNSDFPPIAEINSHAVTKIPS
jgi:hypothetical protein